MRKPLASLDPNTLRPTETTTEAKLALPPGDSTSMDINSTRETTLPGMLEEASEIESETESEECSWSTEPQPSMSDLMLELDDLEIGPPALSMGKAGEKTNEEKSFSFRRENQPPRTQGRSGIFNCTEEAADGREKENSPEPSNPMGQNSQSPFSFFSQGISQATSQGTRSKKRKKTDTPSSVAMPATKKQKISMST